MLDFERGDLATEEPSETPDATPEQRLFQMVIVVAVGDALGHVPNGSQAMIDARQWILSSPDFCNACDIAGWDYESLRERVRKLIREGFKSQMISDTGRRIRQPRMIDK